MRCLKDWQACALEWHADSKVSTASVCMCVTEARPAAPVCQCVCECVQVTESSSKQSADTAKTNTHAQTQIYTCVSVLNTVSDSESFLSLFGFFFKDFIFLLIYIFNLFLFLFSVFIFKIIGIQYIKHFLLSCLPLFVHFMSGCNDISLTTGLNVRMKARLGR